MSNILWTPAEIFTALWLDASDASTITLASGAVSEWRDKSGNNRNATQNTNSAYRPTITTINGLDSILFDGSNDFLAFGSAVVPTTHSLFVVFKPTIESAFGLLLGQWASGQTGRFGISVNQNASTGDASAGYLNVFNASSTNGAASGGVAQHTTITNTTTLIESICTTGSESWKLLKNGTEYESATIPSVYQGTNSAIGAYSASVYSGKLYDGVVCEIIVVPSVLGTDDRQIIEGYLAHKWGFDSYLDADHPYKSAAPTALALSGVVTVNSSPAQRTVLVYKNDDADLFMSTQSDATTGEWQIVVSGVETDRYRVVMVGESGEYSKVFEDVTAG